MTDQRSPPNDARDLLAAEYVIGLTDAADLAVVEAMILSDPAFAAAISGWRARLSPLDATTEPGPADERLWSSIEGALAEPTLAMTAPAVAPAPRPVAPVAAPKPIAARPVAPKPIAPRPAAPTPPKIARPAEKAPGLWHSLAFWRMAGMTGAFAALLLAAGLGYVWRQAMRQPVLIAVLMTDANQAAAVVNAYADGRAELTPLIDIQVPEGKAIEIWTLWDRSVGPRSIGLIQRAGRTTLRLEGLPRTTPGQLFEMTLEPSTGSPTGRPTGPILNKGNATTAL